MKITALLLLAACLHVTASSFGQKVTLSVKRAPLQKVLIEISRQTGISIICNETISQSVGPVSLDVRNMPLGDVISLCLNGKAVGVVTPDNSIRIKPSSDLHAHEQVVADTSLLLKGRVVMQDGTGMPNATVMPVRTGGQGTQTDASGYFSLRVPNAQTSVAVSFVGFTTEVMAAWPPAVTKVITLKAAVRTMQDVEIRTGMFTRSKQTFTGAVASFSGQELKAIGNNNIIQSLRTLDPSFIIAVDNLQGSNPNQLPKIEMRGKTSLTTTEVRDQFSSDPNQPLFILNGMETSLRQIMDLDMNRVKSITLLKDASSTALYGSRAANGVLVVETTPPQPGRMSVSYTADLRWEIPDLHDYNMMNAAENLEFQQLAGMYLDGTHLNSIYLARQYNERLAAVKSGVNSYWLNVPVRNAFSNGHSLRVSGGSQEFQYGVAGSYRKQDGVMKGSGRDTWSGTVDLSYRHKKINVTNQTYINGYNADESPYGSFSTFVRVNPYYRKTRPDGSLNTDKYLEVYQAARGSADFRLDTVRVANPLYNATLNAKNNSQSFNVQNNLNLLYDISPELRLSGGLQLTKGITTNIVFTPSANTMYDQVDVFEKGYYRNARNDQGGYQGNVMLTYRKVLAKVHSITGNIRSEIQEQKNTVESFAATGFPVGVEPNPAFAYGFITGTKPTYTEVIVRRVNALASVNYAYDNRYYADINYRLDGSTSFGAENKYSPFWSLGLGWTINRERFLDKVRWIDLLRLRGNIGTSGNQALGSFASSSIFKYENHLSIFGQGLYLDQLGNPDLEWQNTRSTSVGIDAALFGNRLMLTLNAYEKLSSPLITSASVPASTGTSVMPFNVGKMRTKGAEAILRFSPVYRPQQNMVWTIGYTGGMYTSKYDGVSNALKTLNETAQASASLLRYTDGYSPDELWAVTSLGIDPATGKEVFEKKNGERTFIYDPQDIVPQGNGRPEIEGVLSSNLNMKGFLLGINLRYSIGNYIFNRALYNKVENISRGALQYNQDKRALELRWKQPGDEAQFRSISITDVTPLSSRFVQRENYLSGESINAGYEFLPKYHPWLRKSGLQGLRINAYMNDIFRLSNIRAERGIDYPFSNALACSVNLYF
ncbi:SusC/RagA family TonB-linked outer membrane protein [Chitinophaga horti]|uniref:SusC/RagA family TonB-linked outer membrane protein n=1 Tax=Chitinophaga horti TaxID=2920382 RepID=A0ABY6J572_9BACT|nr:SusC/RagA family TonB-linked outer membrane protein [Chitinophaga horti]UYQ94501.1 SusC/RagA family TonB-linked outer membrane protein [Chitinophaga horti]